MSPQNDNELFRVLGAIEATQRQVLDRIERLERHSESRYDSVIDEVSGVKTRVTALETWRTYLVAATVGTISVLVGAVVFFNHVLGALKGVSTLVRP